MDGMVIKNNDSVKNIYGAKKFLTIENSFKYECCRRKIVQVFFTKIGKVIFQTNSSQERRGTVPPPCLECGEVHAKKSDICKVGIFLPITLIHFHLEV